MFSTGSPRRVTHPARGIPGSLVCKKRGGFSSRARPRGRMGAHEAPEPTRGPLAGKGSRPSAPRARHRQTRQVGLQKHAWTRIGRGLAWPMGTRRDARTRAPGDGRDDPPPRRITGGPGAVRSDQGEPWAGISFWAIGSATKKFCYLPSY